MDQTIDKIKMKTGTSLNVLDEPDMNIKTFILCFTSIIWRRVWITAIIYCKHNNIKNNRSVILNALKYNVFSDAGIGHVLMPYIREALTKGFLMPKTYEKNLYAMRAVMLYSKAYNIIKTEDKDAEKKFIHDYMTSVFTDEKNTIEEESKDTLNISDCNDNINNNKNNHDDKDDGAVIDMILSDPIPCDCKLCELVNSWDVNIDLVYSDDPYQNILMQGLMNTLSN
jgi:hypothetical protein